MPGHRGLYLRWLVHSVLIECRSTLWCARQIGVDPALLRLEFERVCRGDFE